MSFSAEERDRELFRSIVEAFEHIKRYTDGMRLQQVLECAAKLSTDTKVKLKIDWSSLVAMRNSQCQ